MNFRAWVEAMRLRTLPVSIAGVFTAVTYAILSDCFVWAPALLCLLFALLAQIASNFANEYYDYKAGLDKVGREGPRRGVTEGDITPRAMKTATYLTLGIACTVGCSLILWGGWWLLVAGIVIALAVVAYSTGPYPLSHHGLGEVAVMFFFGIIPVNLTYYIMSHSWSADVFLGSLSIGFMGANVLIINNYRDIDDDKAVGKHTLAVILGRKAMATIYLINGLFAIFLMMPTWLTMTNASLLVPAFYLLAHLVLYVRMRHLTGHNLNPLLGMTAMLMFIYSLLFLVAAILS